VNPRFGNFFCGVIFSALRILFWHNAQTDSGGAGHVGVVLSTDLRMAKKPCIPQGSGQVKTGLEYA